MDELISVIMPVYNGENTLRSSIDSVLSQSFRNIKLYVIDDCSTDSTVNIIQSYKSELICYTRNEINLGVAESRNVGINLAKGEFIAFIDSDDLWHPLKLEKQYNVLLSGIDVVCTNYIAFRNEVELHSGSRRTAPIYITYADMLKSNLIGNLTGIYNAKKLGRFYQQEVGHEDYLMWLSIIKKSKKAYCLQEYLAYYRLSSNSLSANKAKAMYWQWCIYRKHLKLSIGSSCYFFIHYMANAFRKRKY